MRILLKKKGTITKGEKYLKLTYQTIGKLPVPNRSGYSFYFFLWLLDCCYCLFLKRNLFSSLHQVIITWILIDQTKNKRRTTSIVSLVINCEDKQQEHTSQASRYMSFPLFSFLQLFDFQQEHTKFVKGQFFYFQFLLFNRYFLALCECVFFP